MIRKRRSDKRVADKRQETINGRRLPLRDRLPANRKIGYFSIISTKEKRHPVGNTINTFEFGPIGNKVVAALVTAVALGGVLLSLWLVLRVVGLAHDVWRARDWPVVQASVLHVSISSAREPRRLRLRRRRRRGTWRGRERRCCCCCCCCCC